MNAFKTIEFDRGGELTITPEATAQREPITALVYTIDYGAERYADFILPHENRVSGDTYIIKNLNGGSRDRATQAPVVSVICGTSEPFEPSAGDGGVLPYGPTPNVRYGLWHDGEAVVLVWSDAYNLSGWFVASPESDHRWNYAR